MANIQGLSAANMTPCTPSIDAAREALSAYFGYEAFRQGQKVLIGAALSRPRRARHYAHGCWQVVVLSDSGDCSAGARAGGIAARFPLMKDQVNALIDAGVRGSFEFDLNAPGQRAHSACARRGGHV